MHIRAVFFYFNNKCVNWRPVFTKMRSQQKFILLICFMVQNVTCYENLRIGRDELPVEITSSIYTNANDGVANSTAKPDNPHRYTDWSTRCGIRGGYYFNRIVGGTNAEEGEFSWQVSIQLRTGLSLRHVCGGAIVAEHWVITAAHCVSEVKPAALSVVAGDHNLYVIEGREQRRNVVNIFTTNFELSAFKNDIALLKTDSPFILFEESKSSPICLPNQGEKFEGLATISGWGRLTESGGSPQTLQQVTLPFIEHYICKAKYERVGFSQYLHQCQICAGSQYGGKDACQGDSGGPLVCAKDDGRYYLCGIVSWGIGCARSEFPGIYTEVSCYVEWIRSTMEKH